MTTESNRISITTDLPEESFFKQIALQDLRELAIEQGYDTVVDIRCETKYHYNRNLDLSMARVTMSGEPRHLMYHIVRQTSPAQ